MQSWVQRPPSAMAWCCRKLDKGKTGTKKYNGRMEINRIQVKEDGALRNSRKTTIVVKSSQVGPE